MTTAKDKKLQGKKPVFDGHICSESGPGTQSSKDNYAPTVTSHDLAPLKRALVETLDAYREAWLAVGEGKALQLDRQGKPVAVVMDYEDFNALLEHLEDLEDAQAAREAIAALERGEETTISAEQLKEELRAEGLPDD